jgi:glycine hydroxymethyltransferase
MFLVNLQEKGITGKEADALLGLANITANKNTVPNDPLSPFITSGIRIGTPAVTTRGFLEPEVVQVATWICDLLDNPQDLSLQQSVKEDAHLLCQQFPVYG